MTMGRIDSSIVSTDEFSALFDAAADAIIVIDDNGIVSRFNTAAERIFGHDASDILGKNVSLLMPERYGHMHDEYIQRHMRTGEQRIIGKGRAVHGIRANGEEFPLYLSVGRVEAGGGTLFVGILQDLSERYEFEAEIARQRQELSRISRQATAGELAAALAHELNQPLSAISTYSGATRRFLERIVDIEEPEIRAELITECVEALNQIESQSLRAGDIINRMRSFIREQETTRDETTVEQLLAEITPIVQLDARAEGVILSLTIRSPESVLDIDRIQIQQVIINLVRNAVDATRETAAVRKPEISLSTRRVDSQRIEFRISDNGPGISPEFEEHLFTPFKTTKHTGLGMGLAISNSIVEAHGDKLRYSTGPEGTSFSFYLTSKQ